MIDDTFRDALLAQLEVLPPVRQEQVLAYARDLATKPVVGTPGRDLRPLAGIMSDEDAEEMLKIIEEGCERIDPNEW